MRVIDQYKWNRTKNIAALVLLLTGIACAGGLETTDPSAPIPSTEGFVISMTLLALLTYNIMKKGTTK
jgi:hypothetical protein